MCFYHNLSLHVAQQGKRNCIMGPNCLTQCKQLFYPDFQGCKRHIQWKKNCCSCLVSSIKHQTAVRVWARDQTYTEENNMCRLCNYFYKWLDIYYKSSWIRTVNCRPHFLHLQCYIVSKWLWRTHTFSKRVGHLVSWCCGLDLSQGLVLSIGLVLTPFSLGQKCLRKIADSFGIW